MNRILTSQEIRFRPLKVKTVLLASADEAQERADQEKVKNENPGQPVALSTSDGGREVALVVFAVVGLVMMIA